MEPSTRYEEASSPGVARVLLPQRSFYRPEPQKRSPSGFSRQHHAGDASICWGDKEKNRVLVRRQHHFSSPQAHPTHSPVLGATVNIFTTLSCSEEPGWGIRPAMVPFCLSRSACSGSGRSELPRACLLGVS